MNIDRIFESRKNNHIWNTSYPLSPIDWTKWRVKRALSFADDKELAFYLHIPFCERMCSFCEYTKTVCRDEAVQRQCVMTLRRDVDNFVKTHSDFSLTGFDIGGGTPTALSEENFQLLMRLFKDTVARVYIQNGSAKFAGENNMKNTAGLPNGWGAQPQRVYNVSQSSNTKKGDRSLPKIN